MSKRLEFNNFKAKVDAGKLSVDFTHEFRPFKDEDIVVKCDYLKNGTLMKYAKRDGIFDMERIFIDSVKEIKGLDIEVNGEEIEPTAENLCNIPFGATEGQAFISTLIVTVATHIISGDTLNEDEVKNFD